MAIRIVKREIPKATIRKYGWKNPVYYEVRENRRMIAHADTKEKAEYWANRARKAKKR
jgi:hypothetical protein